MHKQRSPEVIISNKIAVRVKELGICLKSFIGKYGGRIVYYTCVAIVLSAVACAAEAYRNIKEGKTEDLILPAVEIEIQPVHEEEVFLKPEGCGVLDGFSSFPEWNEELAQWQAHPGVDYLCRDDVVYSVSSGVIKTVGKSAFYGGFIEVETNEYLLRYASVRPDENVKPGLKIEAGERIALADASMPGENLKGAHLHLELMKNEKYMDFEKMRGK